LHDSHDLHNLRLRFHWDHDFDYGSIWHACMHMMTKFPDYWSYFHSSACPGRSLVDILTTQFCYGLIWLDADVDHSNLLSSHTLILPCLPWSCSAFTLWYMTCTDGSSPPLCSWKLPPKGAATDGMICMTWQKNLALQISLSFCWYDTCMGRFPQRISLQKEWCTFQIVSADFSLALTR